MKNIVIFVLFLLCLPFAKAEENKEIPESVTEETVIAVEEIQTNGWSIGIGRFNLNKQQAQQESVGDGVTSLNFAWVAQDGHFVYGAGISGLLYSDKAPFSQDVEGNWGGRSREKSSAEGFGIFGELGYSFVIQPKQIHLNLTAGFEKMWSERSISNCSNCYSENIDIESGLYLRPQIKFISESGFEFNISYYNYLSADIENGISLNFGWNYDSF